MKNSRSKTLLILVLILLIGNIGFLAYIHFNTPDKPSFEFNKEKKREHFENMLFNELELSQEQIDLVKGERKVYRNDKHDIREQMREVRTQINKEITNSNTNMVTIDSLAGEFAEIHIKFDSLNIASLISIKKHLNETQKVKFDSIINRPIKHRKHFKTK